MSIFAKNSRLWCRGKTASRSALVMCRLSNDATPKWSGPNATKPFGDDKGEMFMEKIVLLSNVAVTLVPYKNRTNNVINNIHNTTVPYNLHLSSRWISKLNKNILAEILTACVKQRKVQHCQYTTSMVSPHMVRSHQHFAASIYHVKNCLRLH